MEPIYRKYSPNDFLMEVLNYQEFLDHKTIGKAKTQSPEAPRSIVYILAPNEREPIHPKMPPHVTFQKINDLRQNPSAHPEKSSQNKKSKKDQRLFTAFKPSEDFSTVVCNGKTYAFDTPAQAAVVEVLWKIVLENLPYDPKTIPHYPSGEIIKRAKSKASFQYMKIPEIFRGNKTWKKIIVRPKRGRYGLKIQLR